MFIRHRPFRFSTSRSALLAVIGLIFIAISSIAAGASGFSLLGPASVAHEDKSRPEPLQMNTLVGPNVFTAMSAETLSVVQKALNISLDSYSPMISTSLVISQAYGGGGGTTGTYLHDYVELKNISSVPQSTNGLWLMYGSATGQFGSTTQNTYALANATIPPGKYYLVQLSAAGGAGLPLPVTPDEVTTNLTMGGNNGKVALVTSAFMANTCGATATPCPLPNSNIVDLVAWGIANNAEGGAATNGGASINSTLGNVRKNGGCTETDNNNADFDIIMNPVPRNSATAATICVGGPTPTPTPTASLTPTPTATPTSTPTVTPTPSPIGTPSVVISQVYGGGGNSGATFTNDYIELYNAGTTNVDLSSWSVQYSSATGTGTWQVTNLVGVLAPGHYYLIQQAAGSTPSGPLPTPDAVGTISMGGGAGKVALVSDQIAQIGGCPSGASLRDFVGYGANASCFEGIGAAPAPSNTMSDLRLDGGCIDTNNNANDFLTGAPTPRNSSSTHACGGPTPTPTSTVTPTPTPTQTVTPTGTPTITPTPSPLGTPGVVISQVYGGGGNAGAPFTNDYIEIYNAGNSTVNLTEWSVQYGGATGSTWQVTNLSGSIAPGHYFLIQQGAGSTPSGSLPAPDAIGSILMGSTAGKVVLVSNQIAQSGACPTGVVDLVGYGTTANCFEGQGPAPSPSNTMSDFRINSGCTDTNNNVSDFFTGVPAPRNSSSPFSCGETTPTPTATPTATQTPSPTPTPSVTPTPTTTVLFDYDGDRKADVAVYRPSVGNWYIDQSLAGFFGVSFGIATDKIAPADYDGDAKTDIAVYRPSTGVWYILNSSNGTVRYEVFGSAEDLPTPADYDGDNRADISVFRPSDGNWYRLNSSNGGFVAIQFGATGDQPILGDFDGDNKDDIGVFRPSTGAWYQIYSSDGSFFGEAFGISTDRTIPADYDGDGKTDIAIYRPSEGLWYVKNSATLTYTPYVFGLAQDIPVSADFDGDGKADIGVFRPSDGTWYIVKSQGGGFIIHQFGQNGDIPAQNAFNN